MDGTDRHYQCYRDIVARYGGSPVTQQRYWYLKRNKVKRDELLKETGFQGSYQDYFDRWMETIESEKMLRLDRLTQNAPHMLRVLRDSCRRLVLLTMRNHREMLMSELTGLGILDCFDEIVCCSSSGEHTKCAALRGRDVSASLVIGDTEEDEYTARQYGMEFWAITSGLRERRFLHAERYFECLADAESALETRGKTNAPEAGGAKESCGSYD